MGDQAVKPRFYFSLFFLMTILISNINADEIFNQLFKSGKFSDALKYADEKLPVADRDAATWAMLRYS